MKISVKKLLADVLGLLDEHPEPYIYAVVIEATESIREKTFEAVPEIRTVNVTNPGGGLIAALEREESLAEVRKNFIVYFKDVCKLINKAVKKLPKKERASFLQDITKSFWDKITEEDRKASEEKGRRYGVFWIPFLIGATAVGGIFAYSSGKSTKEYVENEKEKTSPYVYAGIGAAVVLGVMALRK